MYKIILCAHIACEFFFTCLSVKNAFMSDGWIVPLKGLWAKHPHIGPYAPFFYSHSVIYVLFLWQIMSLIYYRSPRAAFAEPRLGGLLCVGNVNSSFWPSRCVRLLLLSVLCRLGGVWLTGHTPVKEARTVFLKGGRKSRQPVPIV